MKKILITGGSKGIGKELVLYFSQKGHKVIFTYNHSEFEAKQLEETASKLIQTKIIGLKCNLADEQQVKEMFKVNKELLSSVDVLINNAGISGETSKLFMFTSADEWWAIMHNNVNCMMNCTRKVLPGMIKQKQGRIINVTSLAGLKGNPGQSAYAASKAAIACFSKSLMKEIERSGVTINCIAPGFVETDMTSNISVNYYLKRIENSPMGRMGTTKEIAKAIYFLAIDAPDYLVNQEIIVDGGFGY